jgi:hypothetical protein
MSSCCTGSILDLRPPTLWFAVFLKISLPDVAEVRAAAPGNPANSRDLAPKRKRVRFQSATGIRITPVQPHPGGAAPAGRFSGSGLRPSGTISYRSSKAARAKCQLASSGAQISPPLKCVG